MAKKMSAAAVVALKEALATVYWYKNDLQSFVTTSIGGIINVSRFDWTKTKRQVAFAIVDSLLSNDAADISALTRISAEVCEMKDFSHLERLEDGAQKAKVARDAVAALNKLLATHVAVDQEKKAQAERRAVAEKRTADAASFESKLNLLRLEFLSLFSLKTPQARGYVLEKVLKELFALFDLDPKASFRNTGEQIDGAFSFDGTEFLLEAKWQEKRCDANDLDGFAAKVRRKLENTLGLFISINGFSEDGLEAHSQGGVVSLLLDGQDLTAVLERRITLPDLLRIKKQHAARKGGGFLSIHQIL